MKRKTKQAGFYLLQGETFPYDILVCLGTSKEEIIAYMLKHFAYSFSAEELDALICKKGRTIHLANGAFLLWLAQYPKTPEGFGHLAHEIFHTADLMLRRAGASLSDDSDEIWAYHVDWITRKIYAAYHFI